MATTTVNTPIQPVKAGDNITIIGRRWFDKVYGNTYFTSVALINGVEVLKVPFTYGYGEAYVYETFKALQEAGYITDTEKYSNGSTEPFWTYCERKGITKHYSVTDVQRKKDLK